MASLLLIFAEPFEQIGNTLLTEDPMWNLMKIAQAVSENKTFKIFTQFYTYIYPSGKGRWPSGDKFD